MKLFNILSVTFLVIFTGCDNLFQDQSVPNPPEFEYLIEDLNSELSLDSEQRSTARNSLERGREFHPDPAALWDLAATLQQVLTPEQKDSLLSKLNNFDSKIISEENDHKHRRIEHLNRLSDYLTTLMTDEQKEVLEELTEAKEDLINETILKFKSNEIDVSNMRFELLSITEWFRAKIKSLLTSEQEEIINNKKNQIDLNWKQGKRGRGKFYKNSGELKLAKYNALELTDLQIIDLEEIAVKVKQDLDNLRDLYISEIDDTLGEEFRLSIIELLIEMKNNHILILTDIQKEIIEIHRALTLRFMKHARWGRDH